MMPSHRSTRRPSPRRDWRRIWLRALRWTGLIVGSGLILVLIIAASLWIWAGGDKTPPDKISWGFTYSSEAAKGLGLDPQAAYRAILDGLHPQRLRLVAYWTTIEPTEGEFDYSDLDSQVAEAERRGIPYIIAIGRKVPRWPECFTPGWAKSQPESEQQKKILGVMARTISRYDSGAHLLRWQVENEPYFIFGECPGPNQAFLHQEVQLVRSLTTKPIMLTDSGEASNWLGASELADVFGSTLYRVVINQSGKPFHHFLWPEVYTRHANLIRKLHPGVKQLVVAELQAEPWTTIGITNIPQSYIDQTLSHQQFQDNIEFARQVGFSEVYLWGAEWWYYRQLHGDSFYWDTAKDVFAQSAP